MTKKTFVIEINSRDDANLRRYDIRRIKPAAQSSLEHGKVHAHFGEIQKRNRRDALKKSRVCTQAAVGEKSFDQCVNASKDFSECLIRYRLAIHSNPLI